MRSPDPLSRRMAIRGFPKRMPSYETMRPLEAVFPPLREGSGAQALETFLSLMATANEVATATNRDLAAHGMAPGRFNVLALLWRCLPDPMTPSELAADIGVTKGNITGLVDGLERDRLIKREGRGRDRRVTPIALTDAGKGLIERILPGHLHCITRLMSGMAREEQEGLVRYLGRMRAGLLLAQGSD